MGNSNRSALRGAVILTVILLLPGCLSWPVSLAISGISYAATGKSISDHLLSGLVQKDCNIGRAILDQSDICQDNEPPQALTISAEEIDNDWSIDVSPASGDGPDGV